MWRGEVFFPCQFTDSQTHNVISLIDGGRYGRVIDRPLALNERLKEIKFSSGKMDDKNVNSLFYEIEYDRDNRGSQETEVVNRFWMKHPKVGNLNGVNDNLIGEPVLSLEDLTATKKENVDNVEKKFKAYQKFVMLGERGKRNVAYAFGIPNADKMSEQDLTLELIDPSKGILMRTDDARNEKGMDVASSIDRFLKYDSEDFRTQLFINTRRAIEKGVVEQKNDQDGTTYYINNHPVGKDVDGVVNYLDNNKDFYSKYIIEALGDEAEKQAKAAQKKQDEEISTVDVEGMKRTMKQLQDRLVAVGVKGAGVSRWNTVSNIDKMKDSIAEAEAILKEKEVTAS